MTGTASCALRLRFADGIEIHDDGRVLVGGTRGRVLRVTDAGSRLVGAWRSGEEVGDGVAERSLAGRLIRSGFANPSWEGGPFTSQDVTVVIPVLDDPDGLRSAVAALDPRLDVVVVDDGSADPDAIARAAGRARVVRSARPRGPAAARNLGRSLVETSLSAFVDADCRPDPGWLDELLHHFADPAVAAVAPRIRSQPGPTFLERYEAARSPLDLGADPALVAPRTRVSYVPSTCLLVRSDVPDFDASLRFGEDVDLVWRLIAAGKAVRYEPGAEVWHRPRSTWRDWWRQRRDYGTAAAPLAKRHPAAAVPLAVDRRAAAVWGLVVLRRPVLAAVAGTGTGAALRRELGRLGVPARRSVALAVRGHLRVGRYLASATTRSWWPIAVVAGLVSRRARPALLAAAFVPSLVDWWGSRPGVDPVRYVAMRLVDDAAYGVGLWTGCWAERSARALRPTFTEPNDAGRLGRHNRTTPAGPAFV